MLGTFVHSSLSTLSYVHNIVQKCMVLKHPQEKEMQKEKMVVWEGLTNSREEKQKGKGEKEGYTTLSAEFQRIARRDKKAFLSEQCKEVEENNRMGKTRDLIRKTKDTTGTFHAKMGSIKDKNGMDLNAAEMLRGGKNTQNYTKKILMTRITMMMWSLT